MPGLAVRVFTDASCTNAVGSATIGSTPAVQNAVVDALAEVGITHFDMPASPPRVWEAIRKARS